MERFDVLREALRVFLSHTLQEDRSRTSQVLLECIARVHSEKGFMAACYFAVEINKCLEMALWDLQIDFEEGGWRVVPCTLDKG